MSAGTRTATVALACALASYAFGVIALFSPGADELDDVAVEWYVAGIVVTATLNTIAIGVGLSAKKSEAGRRRRALIAIWLGVLGYLGTAVLALAIFGHAMAQVGR